MAQSIDGLRRFEIPDVVRICGEDGGPRQIAIATPAAAATISLFGAQLTQWQPAGYGDILWLSEAAANDQRTAIRGGIPVCWPWFGADARSPLAPSHGFARTSGWALESATETGDAIALRFGLPILNEHSTYWPHRTRPTVTYTIGEALEIELTTTNCDAAPIDISQALHTYFSVGDIEGVLITGLESAPFIDKLTGLEVWPTGAPITFAAETDRIYRRPASPIRLHDPGLGRMINIAHEGASSAVVWNPWADKSARLGDIGGADAYRGMVCIETGNVAPDGVTLEPGATHTVRTTIAISAATD